MIPKILDQYDTQFDATLCFIVYGVAMTRIFARRQKMLESLRLNYTILTQLCALQLLRDSAMRKFLPDF